MVQISKEDGKEVLGLPKNVVISTTNLVIDGALKNEMLLYLDLM